MVSRSLNVAVPVLSVSAFTVSKSTVMPNGIAI